MQRAELGLLVVRMNVLVASVSGRKTNVGHYIIITGYRGPVTSQSRENLIDLKAKSLENRVNIYCVMLYRQFSSILLNKIQFFV